jgi:Protein of unknown function (DUF3574)
MKVFLASLAAFALSGCVAISANDPTRIAIEDVPYCVGGEPRAVAQVFFGRNIGDGLGVSDADWERFLDSEVTPRFPDGLTVQDALGQWRDSDSGRIVREPSKVLTLILGDEREGRAAIAAIADAYKVRFRQQAVAVVVERGCVAF